MLQSGARKRFLPLCDRVLIQRAEAATKSKGSILIPEKTQKVREGTVVAAGPGGRNEQTGTTIKVSAPLSVNVFYAHRSFI